MKAVEVVGDRTDEEAFVSRLVDRLAEDGRVATIVHRPDGGTDGVVDAGARLAGSLTGESAATETYEVTPSG